MTARQVGWTLPLWVALACIGFLWAPKPPERPAPTEAELAADRRAEAIALRDTTRWQEERGDRAQPWDEADGHMAIVIDDVGRELHILEKLLSLRYRLTFAVLPGSVYAMGSQLRLQHDRRRYREILIHLPMEPLDTAQMLAPVEADETFLLATDSRVVLQEKVAAAIESVPAAIGVNNHMGSRLTAEPESMRVVMEALRESELFFLDSRTNPQTVAEAMAKDAGLVTGARHVFLDNDVDTSAISRQLDAAATLSRTQPVIAIGHPSVELYEVLDARLPELFAEGVSVYPLSHVLGRTNAASP